MQHGSPEDARGNWCALCEGLHESPKAFYELVAAAVAKREIPDAKLETVEHREGGAFSGVRLYLRVRRNREAFDVCGAPFGKAFFFSWWFADLRPALPRLATVFVVFGYFSVLGSFMQWLGVVRGPVTLILLVPLILWGVSQMGTQAADDAMLSLPFLGPLYARLFRPITYYRADTSAMFQKSVEEAVKEAIDQLTEGKGVRALTEAERKPMMRDFWKK
jgi:hypothetical protein